MRGVRKWIKEANFLVPKPFMKRKKKIPGSTFSLIFFSYLLYIPQFPTHFLRFHIIFSVYLLSLFNLLLHTHTQPHVHVKQILRSISWSMNLPPGFRFFPTDEELVVHFLHRRASLLPCHPDVIPDLDLYPYDPWDLPGMYTHMHIWYPSPYTYHATYL